jgi:hypothetical protein
MNDYEIHYYDNFVIERTTMGGNNLLHVVAKFYETFGYYTITQIILLD